MKGSGSVKKEGSTWYFVVTLGKKPNGKPNQKKQRGFRTKEDATKALNKVIYEYQNGTYVEPSKMLYSELLKKWLDYKERRIQRTTFESYKILVDKHIQPRLGSYKIPKIKSLHIQDFYNELQDEVGLSGTTVQKVHMVIKDSLRFAVKMELLAKNPADTVDRPKGETVEVEVWAISEIKRFLQSSQEDPLYIAYHLALMTGMRQGEILGLRWSDIDFNKKRIMIRQTLTHDGKELKAGAKTKSGNRLIQLMDETITELIKHKEKVENDKNETREAYSDDLDLVVCTSVGTPVNPSNLRRSFNRQIKKANLKKIRFHDLRHSHATMLLELNINPKVVSERLGHANIRITLDTYSHVLPTMQTEVADRLSQVMAI